MPTIFIQDGYRVSFYSYDLAERMHVHVFKDGHECKIWLDDLVVAFNRGFKRIRLANPSGQAGALVADFWGCQEFLVAFHAAGISSATRLAGHCPSLGRTSAR